MKLHIITACSRPQNLKFLARNIKNTFLGTAHEYFWTIIYDEKKTGHIENDFGENVAQLYFQNDTNLGEPLKNFGLYFVAPGNYVYILDDDNFMHPNIRFVLDELQKTNAPGAVFEQLLTVSKDKFEIREIDIRVYHIDQAQYIWRKQPGDQIPEAYFGDGIFITKRFDDQWLRLNYPAAFYNYLESKI
jgi:hypothetical protein